MNRVLVDRTAFSRRTLALLMGVLGAVALLLAAMGIYGVISYLVAQRTREMGIRLALGAQRHDLLKLVLGQGVRLTMIGVAAGLTLALTLTRRGAKIFSFLSCLFVRLPGWFPEEFYMSRCDYNVSFRWARTTMGTGPPKAHKKWEGPVCPLDILNMISDEEFF